MDLTKFLGQDSQEQSAQRLSKEEYAAQKKQEREEIWGMIDGKAAFPLAPVRAVIVGQQKQRRRRGKARRAVRAQGHGMLGQRQQQTAAF